MRCDTKITDRDELRKHWESHLSREQIAHLYGCSTSAVTKAVKRFGLPSRADARRYQRDAPPTPPAAPVEEVVPVGLTAALIATKGRYLELEKLARREGLSSTQILQRYHNAVRGQ